ncbi:MAG: PTS sugar transporter subunit IIA [Pirellulaceae bacterium]
MASADFDLDSLARYLHITPAQVQKMSERGTLPGRKVGGAWKFPQAEIHHWLEERIGAADDADLAAVEKVLSGAGRQEPLDVVSIAGLIPHGAIAVPLAAKTKSSVITAMVDLAAETGLLWDTEKLTAAVRERENLHPTALENGVALLHPRRPLPQILAEPLVALGITPGGIPFGESHGVLTDVFFLICSDSDASHLRILARLSRLITAEGFLPALRAASDAAAARDCLERFEKEVGG